MVLKDLLAISGSPGLYKFIAQGKNAVIVENIENGKRTSAHGAAKVSSLGDIAVFTKTEELPLSQIFDKIFDKEEGSESINHKSSPDELKKYFEELLPEYDRDRVYLSDIRKIIQWYNILHSLNMLKKEDADKPEDKPEDKTKDKAEDKTEDKAEDKSGSEE